jgi:hypothetical protein
VIDHDDPLLVPRLFHGEPLAGDQDQVGRTPPLGRAAAGPQRPRGHHAEWVRQQHSARPGSLPLRQASERCRLFLQAGAGGGRPAGERQVKDPFNLDAREVEGSSLSRALAASRSGDSPTTTAETSAHRSRAIRSPSTTWSRSCAARRSSPSRCTASSGRAHVLAAAGARRGRRRVRSGVVGEEMLGRRPRCDEHGQGRR